MGNPGGNPNALTSPDLSEIVAIDHDNAFDETFCISKFKDLHLAKAASIYWRSPARQTEWIHKAQKAFNKLDAIWAELPEDWLEDSTLDNTNSSLYTVDKYKDILRKPFEEPEIFWNTILQ